MSESNLYISPEKLAAFTRIEEKIPGNPLLTNDKFLLCLDTALTSPCQKMKFGCLATIDGLIVARRANLTNPNKKDCENGCVRLSITSRLDQDKGSCDHAEEWTLRSLRKQNINPAGCELYVAGLFGDGSPYIKKDAVFTCPRCAVQLENAGIKAINVPVIDHWETIPGNLLVAQAKAYTAKLR